MEHKGEWGKGVTEGILLPAWNLRPCLLMRKMALLYLPSIDGSQLCLIFQRDEGQQAVVLCAKGLLLLFRLCVEGCLPANGLPH